MSVHVTPVAIADAGRGRTSAKGHRCVSPFVPEGRSGTSVRREGMCTVGVGGVRDLPNTRPAEQYRTLDGATRRLSAMRASGGRCSQLVQVVCPRLHHPASFFQSLATVV